MAVARTRAHFLELMEIEGYRVRWEEDRKYITYTTPEGKQCRDIRLHKEKYVKENMEREFRIRKQILRGPEETGEREYEHRSQSGARISGNGEELGQRAEFHGRNSGNTNQVIIVPESADTIHLIYSSYISGMGFKAIARMLNEQNHKTPAKMQLELIGKRMPKDLEKFLKKYLWDATMVSRILQEEA